MKHAAGFVLALIVLPLCAFAVDNPCVSAVPAFVNSQDGIAVFRLKLAPEGRVQRAYLVIPSKTPVAEILFADNFITYFGKDTGFLDLAIDLAKGGAASVLLNQTYIWPIEGPDSSPDGDPIECAWQWMKAHLPIDQRTFWYVGPRYTTSSNKQLQTPGDLWGSYSSWVPIGFEEGAGGPVDHMNTQGGRQAMADTLHQHVPTFGPVTVRRPTTVAVEDEY